MFIESNWTFFSLTNSNNEMFIETFCAPSNNTRMIED